MSWTANRVTVAAFLAACKAAGSKVTSTPAYQNYLLTYNNAVAAYERGGPDLKKVAERAMLFLADAVANRWKDGSTPGGFVDLLGETADRVREEAEQLPNKIGLGWVPWVLGAGGLAVVGLLAWRLLAPRGK